MAADRAKVCLQKKAFAPYALPSETLDRQFYVKVYSGNNLTDQPEFREVQQRPMKLSSLLATRDNMLQFKVDLDRYADRFFPGLARTTANVGCAFCKKDAYTNLNVRISGAGWRFPSHFDAGDQVILHHLGVKRWTIEGQDYECEPGDVLFIPVGVWHSATNWDEGACMISNAQFDTEATPELAQRFSELYKHRFQIKSDDLRVVDEDAVCGDEA
jgi:hypothetical protein